MRLEHMLGVVTVFGIFAVGLPRPPAAQATPRGRALFGDAGLKVLGSQGRVEIAVIKPQPAAGPNSMAGYPVVGEVRALPPRLAWAWREELRNEANYLPADATSPFAYERDVPKPGTFSATIPLCGHQPTVALRIWPENADGRRTRARAGDPLEISVCFLCNNIRVWNVAVRARDEQRSIAEFHSGATRLLLLATAGLPDDPTLRSMLASEQRQRARELLFHAALPPEAQLLLTPETLARPLPPGQLLGLPADPKQRLVVMARALGAGHKRRPLFLSALADVTPQQFLAGLDSLRDEREARAGASYLFFWGMANKLDAAIRARWAAVLAEDALALLPLGDPCQLLVAVGTMGASTAPFLNRVYRDEATIYPHRDGWPQADPSRAACALLGLAFASPADARRLVAASVRSSPRDEKAIEAVRFVLDPAAAGDRRLVDSPSGALATAGIGVVRRAPTLAGLDRLAEAAPGISESALWFLVHTMNAVTGMPTDSLHSSDAPAQRRAVQDDWKTRRSSWQPPTAR